MKKIKLLVSLFCLFGSINQMNSQNWLTAGNTPTTPISLGTTTATTTSLNSNVNFIRKGAFAGHIQENDLSLGVFSFNSLSNSGKGTVAIGPYAGRYNNAVDNGNLSHGRGKYICRISSRNGHKHWHKHCF